MTGIWLPVVVLTLLTICDAALSFQPRLSGQSQIVHSHSSQFMSSESADNSVGSGMLDLVFGFVKTKVAYQFSKLCAADILTNSNGSAESFAAAANMDHSLSLRFLRAAVAVDLLTECNTSDGNGNGDGNEAVFAPTELGLGIGSINSPGRGIVLLEASPEYASAWDQFDRVLQTGEIGWELAHGVPRIYDSIDESKISTLTSSGSGKTLPGFRDTFYQGLRSWGGMEEGDILSAAGVRNLIAGLPSEAVVADIGGGEGSFASKLLGLRSDISVLLQEQAVTCEAARSNPVLKPLIDTNRVTILERSFFDGVLDLETNVVAAPHLYILKYVLHNWGDDDCIQILRNVRTAIEKQANVADCRILIIEHGPIESTPEIRLLDLHMAVLCGKGATERTTTEYSRLLEKSGLVLHNVHSSKGAVYALECGIK
eukprot:CAMPEP_0194443106 /NCGR_PEP_ID=MMETSP0176-20130528/126519_1 /TAXON_ID=216777 /ORGANISM="Proboscia alata, Strain PI-D3" /LENGTH=427 /DNA_ID=CAMNT_0039269313 /DNA_START=95 /DNA_END=1378 /DNA_ORIENTATION=+